MNNFAAEEMNTTSNNLRLAGLDDIDKLAGELPSSFGSKTGED